MSSYPSRAISVSGEKIRAVRFGGTSIVFAIEHFGDSELRLREDGIDLDGVPIGLERAGDVTEVEENVAKADIDWGEHICGDDALCALASSGEQQRKPEPPSAASTPWGLCDRALHVLNEAASERVVAKSKRGERVRGTRIAVLVLRGKSTVRAVATQIQQFPLTRV